MKKNKAHWDVFFIYIFYSTVVAVAVQFHIYSVAVFYFCMALFINLVALRYPEDDE